MPQEIRQDIAIDVSVKNGDAAIKTLDLIDSKIKSISKNAKQLSVALSSIKGVGGLSKLDSSLRLNSKNIDSATKKTKKYKEVLDGLGSKVPTSNIPNAPNIKPVAGGAPKTSSSTSSGGSGGEGAAKALAKASSASNLLNAASIKASDGVAKLRDSLLKSSDSAKDASWNFFRTRAAIAAMAMAVGVVAVGIKKLFDLSSDYAEASHIFYTTIAASLSGVADSERTVAVHGKDMFGNATDEVIMFTPALAKAAEEVDRFSASMLLDSTNVKRVYSTFYEMAYAAGMATDKIGTLSQGMLQLSYDIASLWNEPFEDVARSMASGISGISSAVRKYGIDISRAAADQWLLDNGFQATYNSLTRANKMIVMYNMIMEHTKSAQGDLARAALQPANMFRILGEQASMAGRSVGAALFPVLTKLIPVFIMIAQAIQRAMAALSAFLGMILGSWYTDAVKQWSSYLDGLNQSFSGGFTDLDDDAEDTSGSIDDIGNSAASAGKKLKELTNFTLPFDELNMLQKPDTSTGGGGGGGGTGGGASGGGSGIDIPVTPPPDFDTSLIDKITKEAQDSLNRIKAAIDKVFGDGTVKAFTDALKSMGDAAKENLGIVADAVGRVVKALIGLMDWPEFIRGFADGFNAVTGAAAKLASWVATVVEKFTGLDFVKNFFKDNSYTIGKFVGSLAGAAAVAVGFKVAMKVLSLAFSPISGAIKLVMAPLGLLVKMLTVTLPTAVSGVAKTIQSIAGTIAGAFAPEAEAVAGSLGGIGTAAEEVGGAAAVGAEGVGGFSGVLGALAGPIGIVIGVIAVLAAAFVGLYNTNDEFKDEVNETWNNIQGVFQTVGDIIQPILEVFKESLIRIGESLGATMDPAKDLFGVLGDLLKPVLEALLPIFQGIADILGGAFVVAIGVITGSFSVLSYTIQGASEILSGIFEVFTGIAEFLTGIFTGDLGKVQQGFDDMGKGIGSIVNGILDTVTGVFKGIGDTVVGILKGFGIDVTGIWDGIKDGIDGIVNGISGTVTDIFNGLVGTVTGTINGFSNTVQSIFQGIGSFLSDPIATAYHTIDGIIQSIGNLFHVDWHLPDIKLPHFKWSSTEVFGIQIPIFDGIEWYAKGGIFDNPTIAGLGESGPETIMPLQGARMMPFAEAVASNLESIQGGRQTASGGLDGDALVEAISISVYNAMMKGFPKEIKTSINLDGKKLNKELDTLNRRQNANTSPLSAVG